MGFVFVACIREKSLMCVLSALISDKSCAAGHPGQNRLSILSVDLFLLLIVTSNTLHTQLNTCWILMATRRPLSSDVEAEKWGTTFLSV